MTLNPDAVDANSSSGTLQRLWET